MTYRPEGWRNLTQRMLDKNPPLPLNTLFTSDDSFEAGADAMLEALKKEGQHMKKGESGTLVFIPDEDE